MSDDLIQLYSKRILALAAESPHAGRLPDPDGSAMKRSPLCGSTVTVDVNLENGRITRFAQDVKACALGQASASALGGAVIGQDRAAVQTGRDQLAAMLKNAGAPPLPPFAELEALKPARDYKNRHASILLAWDATLAAMDAADAKKNAAG